MDEYIVRYTGVNIDRHTGVNIVRHQDDYRESPAMVLYKGIYMGMNKGGHKSGKQIEI